jgi:hypothetical protein
MRRHVVVSLLLLLTVIGVVLAQTSGPIGELRGYADPNGHLLVTLGSGDDSVSAVQGGSWSVDATVVNTPTVTVDNLGPTSSSTYAVTPCYHTTTASTNAISCADATANLYGVRAISTSTTLAYLRLYNLAAAPTCSSATGFIVTIPIKPSAASSAEVTELDNILPINFTTGIGFCVTGGASSTDNTNATAGIYLTLKYKE